MNELALTGVAAVVAAAIAGFAALKYEDNAWRVKWDAHIAADVAATQQFKDAAAAQEKANEDRASKTQQALDAATVAAAKYRHDLDALRVGVRDTITTYANGDRCGLPQAPGAAPSPDGRAVVLGQLLGQCADLLATGAGDAVTAAGTIRAFQQFNSQGVKP